MFKATMTMVEREYDPEYEYRNSDQLYFQDVWADQELARIRLRDGGVRPPILRHQSNGDPIRGEMRNETKERTEYHVSIDYTGHLFQTAAAYTEYLTWMVFNHTTPAKHPERRRRLDEIELPSDLAQCDGPFPQSSDPTEPTGFPNKRWHDMVLGVNVITQNVFPLLHFTGDKVSREETVTASGGC
jgi:hypothetical protein